MVAQKRIIQYMTQTSHIKLQAYFGEHLGGGWACTHNSQCKQMCITYIFFFLVLIDQKIWCINYIIWHHKIVFLYIAANINVEKKLTFSCIKTSSNSFLTALDVSKGFRKKMCIFVYTSISNAYGLLRNGMVRVLDSCVCGNSSLVDSWELFFHYQNNVMDG